jgi:O-antigen/teichoic acid export membrane protein
MLPNMNSASHLSALRALLKRWIGLDRAIAYTVMARFWSVIAGLITLLLITRFLSPSEQGYYYTFYSLVALQIVFELGFSFVILQLAAHERAQLTFLPDGRTDGDAIAQSRLASILQKAVRWYSVAGLVMAAALLPAGLYFFQAHQPAGVVVEWKAPWCLLVIATMLAFQIDPVFSFLEGCGFVAQVAHRRLVQAILGSFLAWCAILTHHGLYSAAMVILGQVVVGLTFLLFSKHRRLLSQLLFYPSHEHFVGWRREILPFQWRIAVSWICGYFIYQIFSPVLFAYQGPIAAGRVGMSLNIATAIGSVALAWMNTKAAPFGTMIARGEYQKLDKLFFRTLWQSTAMLFAGEAMFILVLLIAEHRFPHFAMRVLSPGVFALLLMGTVINHVTTSEALYLRAHKQEPFLAQAVISAVLIGSLTFFLGKHFGANAVVIGLFAQGVLFGLPSGIYIFVKKRREWHNMYSESAA